MEKEELIGSDPYKKWITEAGTESPGEAFHLSVLQKIEVLPKVNLKYEPVISTLGWKLIFTFVSVLFAGTLVFNPSKPQDSSLFDKLPPFRLLSPNFELYNLKLPSFELSAPFLIGIVTFFILGFLMIAGTIRNKEAGI